MPEQKRLAMEWADGAETVYDYSLLRGEWPCAGCEGHLVGEIEYKPPRTPVDLFLIEPVGNYALSFLFSDGHHTGIYRFEFLRTLEQREQRRQERLRAASGAKPTG